ncbi:hypothetical protein [Candidatus Tisiphia endosymbiont of Beris chalybata]|uniref:hypothetical protein n=1 Tax=Candidatus Tisiphia endosymbiont of Beris chalybata TaxID=3066262 RepID=UPI00312C9894
METNKSKNNLVLFNINGFNESENGPSQKDLNIFNTPFEIADVKHETSIQGRDISDIINNPNNVIREILEEAEEKNGQPIVNIQFNNNNKPLPIIIKTALEKLKELGIKVCFSFNHYNTGNEEFNKEWRPLLTKANHVFFANIEDKEAAIDKAHITADKATHIQSITTSLNTEVKKLGKDARIAVINVPLNNADMMTDLIMTKFNIGGDNAIDKKNLKEGIMIEVAEILQLNGNVPAKLEKYISQISSQFENDRKTSNQQDIYKENPIDIYLSLKPALLPNTYNAAQKQSEIQQANAARLKTALNKMVTEPATQEAVPQARNQATVREKQGLQNPNYLYFDEDITTLLKASVDPAKVSVCEGSAGTGFSLDSSKMSISYLENRLTQAVNDLRKEKIEAAVCPVETGGGHWVGLAIKRDENNNIKFIYNDPTGNPIGYRPDLLKLLKKIAPDSEIDDLKIRQQQNDKGCGPFVVDNLIKMAKGEPILTAEESKGDREAKLREEHQSIIESGVKTRQIQQALTERQKSVSPSCKPTTTVASMISNQTQRKGWGR